VGGRERSNGGKKEEDIEHDGKEDQEEVIEEVDKGEMLVLEEH